MSEVSRPPPPSVEAPLRGLQVLELASILAGPVTGQFLAELGADVIKVENPATRGDPTRGWRLADEDPTSAVSAYFSCANWGKRSIAVDVTTEAGRDLIHRLADRSDIVIASYKPGDDARLGVDAPTLLALNPRLVYAQISAYGDADPRPGFDAIIQAESGFTYLNGEADGPPVKMPVALVDLLAAHQLKEAILLALLDAAISSLANQASNFLVAGVVPERMGSEHPNIVPYGAIYRLSDGRELVLAVGTERQWRALTQALGQPELADDPRFADNRSRVVNRRLLHGRLTSAFAGLTSAEAGERLLGAGVPFGFVNDMQQVFAQPGGRRGLMTGGTLTGVRTFVAAGLGARTSLPPPPAYNADGRDVLDEIGYDAAARRDLVSAGAWPGEP